MSTDMSLPKEAIKKYERDGFLSLMKSGGSRVAQKLSYPIANSWYQRSRKISRSELLTGQSSENVIQLDSRKEAAHEYDIPFGLSKSDPGFRYMPRYKFRDQYVVKLQDIRLLGPDALPMTKERDLISEAIETPEEDGYRLKQTLNRTVSDYSAKKSYLSGSTEEYDCVCSLTTSWSNYYHWMVEHLPKLRAIEAATNEWDIQPELLIPANPPSYITESLELMGYSPDDCIQWDSGLIETSNYIQPTFTEPTKQVCNWIQKRALDNMPKDLPEFNSNRVYVSREKTTQRNIVNRKEVEVLLSDFGFEKYTTEDLSVPEQVALFSNADTILGAHGAGLTDMIWSNNLSVVELFNNVVKPPYFQMSQELGLDYYPIQGTSIGDSGYNSDMKINTDELETVLQKVTSNKRNNSD